MSIWQTKDRVWRYEFQIHNRRYTKQGFETKTDAKNAMQAHKELFGHVKGKSIYSISKFNGQKDLIHQLFRAVYAQMDVRPPEICRMCKKKKRLIAHHGDYTKPFKILWLCHSCHNKRHAEIRDKIGPPNAPSRGIRIAKLMNIFLQG